MGKLTIYESEISFVYLILNVGKAFQSNSYHALQIHERFLSEPMNSQLLCTEQNH